MAKTCDKAYLEKKADRAFCEMMDGKLPIGFDDHARFGNLHPNAREVLGVEETRANVRQWLRDRFKALAEANHLPPQQLSCGFRFNPWNELEDYGLQEILVIGVNNENPEQPCRVSGEFNDPKIGIVTRMIEEGRLGIVNFLVDNGRIESLKTLSEGGLHVSATTIKGSNSKTPPIRLVCNDKTSAVGGKHVMRMVLEVGPMVQAHRLRIRTRLKHGVYVWNHLNSIELGNL